MSVIDFLIDDNNWIEYLNYKNNQFITKKEYKELNEFISNKKYIDITSKIVNNTYTFSIPKKVYINKNKSSKKRIVYKYNKEEVIILKMIQYLMNEYDYLLCKNCYSFRREINSKDAFYFISKNNYNKYGYKLDIKNYFNSIPTNRLLEILKNSLDKKDYLFFYKLLSNNKVIDKNNLISENKGAMAGCPISCFLSNIYLADLDKHFENEIYARYADDIIIFNDNYDELINQIEYIHNFLKSKGLCINSDKEEYINKNEEFNFLGFKYYQRNISLANHTVYKMKHKLKRKAKALRRWAKRKNIDYYKACKAYIKIFNYKFFYENKNKELNWSLWYFPVINNTDDLKIIEQYFLENIRYIITGKYSKSNKWKVPYYKIKELGYISLVNKYYKYKNRT